MDRPFPMRCAILVATAFALLPVAAGAAGPADLEPAFGNTIVSTHPDGRKARLWIDRSGTYRAQGRKGQTSGGVWSVKGGKLCLKQKRPISIPFPYCTAIRHVEVGASWVDRAVNGDRVTNRLIRGSNG
jgi:hypothetical protein